ncbi:MAG: hypothetical protein NC308_08375, partial [Clostridium sp.]|nr:hypothetical protein [Clostridium sp.]
MSDNTANNKRIAKNTMLLYLRMFFILIIGIFTSRVVLNTLGVEDYGLYNVVGGFVAFFTFLNGAMSTATQRFITFELAKGNVDRQIITFSTAVIIHFSIAVAISVLAETVGLWFVYNKLVIPSERFGAALWVYHFSIMSTFISIVSIPYNAMLIAHEKMSTSAYISILDTILKLVVVYCLVVVSWDRLIVYAALLFCVSLLDRIIYGVYCKRHFEEAKFRFSFNKDLFKEMTNIAGWSLFGNLAGIGYTQGVNVLLNMFFGPTVNAARGIAVTVQGIVSGFVSNFQMAVNPQITKNYAMNDLNHMHLLIFASSKFSLFLLWLIVFPIMLETQTILELWLKIVPVHTVWFLRFILCVMLIDTLANPLMVSSQAVGKVKVYQSVVGGILLLIVPVAYLVLCIGGNPESVFVVHLCFAIVAQVFRVVIVGNMINLSFNRYFKNVVAPCFYVIATSIVIPIVCHIFIATSILTSFCVILVSVISTIISIYLFGLNTNEKKMVVDK